MNPKCTEPIDRLIVALDFPDVDEARKMTERLGDTVTFYKIGMELIYADGLVLALELIDAGKHLFIDAKLLDIGHTVERATANIARLGAEFLTVHGTDSKTVKAAVKGRGDSDLKLLAVTVMTNLTGDDLAEQHILTPTKDLVLHRAELANAAGFDGVISSAREAADIRDRIDGDFLIVTPGIRPAGAKAGDQSRVMTPAKAIAAGADYLVVGRPITRADDPPAAAKAIVSEITSAL